MVAKIYAGVLVHRIRFMDLEKAYDRVNREPLWQVLRMYDLGPILLNRTKSMYVNNLMCLSVNGA